MISVRFVFIAVICAFSFACTSQRPTNQPTASKNIQGIVIAVADGDTLTVVDLANRQHRIRLKGIDAPEDAQAFSSFSRQGLTVLTFHKSVSVQYDKMDQYGRVVGKVTVEGKDINLQLLADGMAWFFRQYESELTEVDRTSYMQAELAARASRRGLWTEKDPMPPWEYRTLDSRRTLADTSESGPKTRSSMTDDEAQQVVGNQRSRVYHRPDCPGYRDVSPRNSVYFNSAEEAEAAGYRVAGNCP